MKVFYSDAHKLHAPRWYLADGVVRPCPESALRVEKILAAVRGNERFELTTPKADPWPAIRAVHAADYLEYLEKIHAAWNAEFGKEGGGGGEFVIPDTFVPRRNGGGGQDARGTSRPEKMAAQAGYYCFDMAAPIGAGTFVAAVASAKCAVAAAQAPLAGTKSAYALCRPPGHHAGRDYCGGFCYLNNAAIAAERLLLAGMKRVAILDMDYHHGNGTQDIFYARGDVLFISIHADPNSQYPYFCGYANETGIGPGAGFNVNLPLPRGTAEPQWFAALTTAGAHIRPFAPQALIVAMGLDVSEADTVGDFKVSRAGFAQIGETLAKLHLPTLFVQEGGYELDDIGESAAAMLSAFDRNC